MNGRRCVASHLSDAPVAADNLYVVAIGKAACSMALGADDAFGIAGHQGKALLLIGRDDCAAPLNSFASVQTLISSHPLPDQRSLAAGDALVHFLEQAPATAEFVFLLSGGASALVEVLADGVILSDLQRANHWLLGSGLPIQTINQVRRRLSKIKGGKLLANLRGRVCRVLLISDVMGDDPGMIGSGLLTPPSDARVDLTAVPEWLQSLCAANTDAPNGLVETSIIARNGDAVEAIVAYATKQGFTVTVAPEMLGGDVETAAGHIAGVVLNADPGLYLWGGETTVQLPDTPGRGGRNQHLGLLLAQHMKGRAGITLMCVGTDGSDGNSDDTGTIVDGGTVARGHAHGGNVDNAIRRFDSGGFLALSGDLVNTGPTGTNVMDLVMVVVEHVDA